MYSTAKDKGKYRMVAAKVESPLAATFEQKAGKRNQSLVIRELIKKFCAGEIPIVVVKTLGG